MADTNKSAPFRREGADLLPRPGPRTRNGSDKFLPPTLGPLTVTFNRYPPRPNSGSTGA